MLRKYGLEVLSKREFYFEIVRSHLKSTLYRIFSAIKMQHLLSAKRNVKLDTSQVKEVTAVIERIKSFKAG
jgi:hypothetical protein